MHVVCTWYARGTHAVSTGCAHGARPRGALAHGMHTGVHTSTWMCVSMPMLRVGVASVNVQWISSGDRKRGIPFSNEFTSSAVRARACVAACERLACVCVWRRLVVLERTMWSPSGTCRTTGPLVRRSGAAARVPPSRDVSTAPWLLATAAESQSSARMGLRKVQERKVSSGHRATVS